MGALGYSGVRCGTHGYSKVRWGTLGYSGVLMGALGYSGYSGVPQRTFSMASLSKTSRSSRWRNPKPSGTVRSGTYRPRSGVLWGTLGYSGVLWGTLGYSAVL
jgi:hypothetical protein